MLDLARKLSKQSQVGLNTLPSGTHSSRLRLLEPEPQFECLRFGRLHRISLMVRLYGFAHYDTSYFHRLSAAIV